MIAITAIVAGLSLAAVQKVRGRASQAKCAHQLRQIGLALHQYHDTHQQFPNGHRPRSDRDGRPFSGWTLSVLPYLEQGPLAAEAEADFRAARSPFRPPHRHLATVVPHWLCPADPRVLSPQIAPRSRLAVAFTSYLGVSGRDSAAKDGVLYQNSATRLADIADGASNTLLVGERPPSADFQFGWWYAGVGQRGTGSADVILGAREQNRLPVVSGSPCGPGAYAFGPAGFADPCGMFHFWSPHAGGANFAFADGSVRLVGYGAAALLPALASRAGGEPAESP